MHLGELLFFLTIGLIVVLLPLTTFVLSIVAWKRSRRIVALDARVAQLEASVKAMDSRLMSSTAQGPVIDAAESGLVADVPAAPVTDVLAAPSADILAAPFADVMAMNTASLSAAQGDEGSGRVDDRQSVVPSSSTDGGSAGWETFIGQKAFGWVAVILFVCSATFFLRYAFQNNWIGPVGRVAIGELIGVALVAGGAGYDRKGLKRFASMMTSAGIVVVYLSTYSAFGLYQLMPPAHTGFFLAIIVLESMVAAVLYRSLAVAIAAVVGGLLTPLLLASDHDSYRSLFAYLAVLNVGTAVAVNFRRWQAVSSICYLGTQGLFWLWYLEHYHPEKFAWAIGFQGLLFATYVAQSLWQSPSRRVRSAALDQESGEELARVIVNALLGFSAFQILLGDQHREWLGTLALAMASLYAFVARISLATQTPRRRMLLTSLALSLGFVAWALPLQAHMGWYGISQYVAMGWCVIGLALWQFGLRISSVTLRSFAAAFGAAATIRLLIRDLPLYVREPFTPIFNSFALPSLTVAGCILYGVVIAEAHPQKLRSNERIGVGLFGVAGVMLVWLVLSLDCYGYFISRSILNGQIVEWRWRGQLALTVLWTVYATFLLVIGFKFDRARLRWLGMALYATTVVKLFLVDMANVHQLYRIIGFFILAVVLGLVARAYQRFR